MQIVSPESQGFSATRLNRINELLARYVAAGKLAGTMSLVARRDEIVHWQCLGHRDLASGAPLTPDTLFRIYSMTKPITGVAVMMLFEEGHFLLDDPVAAFIPQLGEMQVAAGQNANGLILKPQARPITIRHLLTHTAGLSYGSDPMDPVDALYNQAGLLDPASTMPAMMDKLAGLPLVGQPGAQWVYSIATDVLGHLVEVISGESLGTFFRERIFAPLNMVDTGFYVAPEKQNRLATLYLSEGGAPLEPFQDARGRTFKSPDEMESGGGGLVSTMADYYQFCRMLLKGGELNGERLLGRKTVELMRQNHLPPELVPIRSSEGPRPGMGHGLAASVWVDATHLAGMGSNGTYSWSGAANTHFWVDPTEELCAIFMTQLFPSGLYPVHAQFRTAVYQALVD